MSKRIMREFRIDEISSVDRPAQKGAKMTIMKREAENLDINKEDNMTNKVEKTVEELSADLANVTKSRDETKAALEKAEKLAGMSDAEKTYLEKMCADDKAKKEFMDMSSDERKAKMTAAKKNDETVVISGQTISKSEVGEGAFAIMKAQAEAIASTEARIAKAEKAAAFAQFTKRAADELGNLPGTDVEKAEILEAVAALDDKIAKRLDAILKAANDAQKEAFEKKGVNKSVSEDSAEGKLEKRAKEIAKDEKISFEKAYVKALDENPALYAEIN